jgi:adenylylsulfate kinase
LAGKIKNYTGVSAPYEAPRAPHVELRTDKDSIDDCVKIILDQLKANKVINS